MWVNSVGAPAGAGGRDGGAWGWGMSLEWPFCVVVFYS